MKYTFDKKAADRVVTFIENYCTHVKGELAGKPFILEQWQKKDIICPLFGMKRSDGFRKYRVCYVELPKKNGKTLLAAAVGLYLLTADGEKGAEIYAAAGEKTQASFCFDAAGVMVKRNDAFERNGIKLWANSITVESKNNFFKPLSATADTKHGGNVHGVLFDELHIQKDRKLYDALQTGTANRQQPIIFIITTAGVKKQGEFGWEMHEYAQQVKDGIIQDETFLPVIYGAEDDGRIYQERIWKRCNPNYDISVRKDFMKQQSEKARKELTFLNSFKRFHLNIWTSSESAFIRLKDWDACNRTELSIEDFAGKECVGALDLGANRDFTAFVLIDEDFNILPFFWIPKDNILDRKYGEQIERWVRDGYITATPGNITDYNFVESKIKELSTKLNIREIAYDPWNKAKTMNDLKEEGLNMVEFRQGPKSFSPALKELERKILHKEINHAGNPVLRWMCNNMSIRSDSNDNISPDKENSHDKIDGMVALIMATGRMVFGEKEEMVKSIYDSPDFDKEETETEKPFRKTTSAYEEENFEI